MGFLDDKVREIVEWVNIFCEVVWENRRVSENLSKRTFASHKKEACLFIFLWFVITHLSAVFSNV